MVIESTPLRAIMNRSPDVVHPETPVAEIYRIFSETGRSDILVTDRDGHFLGAINEIDLMASVGPAVGVRSRRKSGGLGYMLRGRAEKAEGLMTGAHLTISPDASVADAIIAIEKNRHPNLVVVENGKVLGLVEVCDIITFLIESGNL